jgi:hypothetical protein
MGFTVKSTIAPHTGAFKRLETALLSSFNRYRDARRRRLEYEEEFYRMLNDYCLANNVPMMWEDEWRMYR